MESHFEASSGSLYHLRQRHGICKLEIHVEALSGNQDCAKAFYEEFHKLVESNNLSYKQIYSLDKSAVRPLLEVFTHQNFGLRKLKKCTWTQSQ